ncbi:splicing regulatory glutamine/lysine-rich protein 1-like [Macadamia integrifolia]|uniref:splicing regulatory glutamine/lysine-rich protein 1-like n=1 Tax=Macadamia integrifolia TaxID=60698 RepID=UPI001C4F88D9|nr:splicing regulatory glutamine/lysine-rich protein 1-like [Macadamia integrifolia]
MSRCFPFPPLGYEKKARTDEADILAKEKHKEKKHKNEKKDKEKKEKKDKERSKDKHKEKKDRKEKHQDKKKDKDRDKDKNKTSDEKKIEGQPGVYNGEKIDQNSQRDEDINGSKFVQDLGGRIRDAEKGVGVRMLENFTGTEQKKAEVMARLVDKDVDSKPEGREKNKVGADQRRAKVGMARVVEKDVSNRAQGKEKSKDGSNGQNSQRGGQKIDQNSQRDGDIKDSKFVQDLDRRIRDAEKGVGVQMLENFTDTEQRKAEVMARFVEKDVDCKPEGREKNKFAADQRRAERMARVVDNVVSWAEGKEKINNDMDQREAGGMVRVVENAVNWAEGTGKKREKKNATTTKNSGLSQLNGVSYMDLCKMEKNDDRKADVQRNGDEGRSAGHAKFQITRLDQQRVEGMVKPMEKDAKKRLEGKEKKKNKEGREKKGDKNKEKDRKKESKAKGKDRSKQKEEKAKEKSDHKNREQDKLKENSKSSANNTISIKTSTLNSSKESNNNSDIDGNLKKRKEREMNGFSHGSDIRPDKLPRPASSSHLLAENGKKVEPCQPAMQFTSDKKGLPNNFKAEHKEHEVNGLIETQQVSVCSTKRFPIGQAIENGETSLKVPHPDLEYLSQILSVTQMEELSDFDDQEWLFSSDSLQSKNPKVGSSVADETPQVWAEALRIESADVCALPYVIPY